jgi:hypothetical protein
LGTINRLAQRTAKAAAEAREYNASSQPDQQEELYRASMNLVAERIYHLARNIRSKPEELRIYLELFLKHREQKIKEKKVTVMLRHLELLEKKRQLLEDAAKDRGLTDAEFFGKIREVFFPENNGHRNQNETPRFLENGVTS